MKLNWGEKLAVNNPVRILQQRLEIDWLKQITDLPTDGSILEIGCGRGVGAQLIADRFHPAALHIQDLDMEMVGKAVKRLDRPARATGSASKTTFTVSDAGSLPYRSESFDAVFGFGVLHHLPDWEKGLREIRRLLKPQGLYYIEELYPGLYQNIITKHILLHPEENRFQSNDLKKALDDAGFALIKAFEVKSLGILGAAALTSA